MLVGMCRRWKALNSFLTRALVSPCAEAAGIQDEVEAEAKDEGSSAVPHHRQHQVPTGCHLSTCEIGLFGCPQHRAGMQ